MSDAAAFFASKKKKGDKKKKKFKSFNANKVEIDEVITTRHVDDQKNDNTDTTVDNLNLQDNQEGWKDPTAATNKVVVVSSMQLKDIEPGAVQGGEGGEKEEVAEQVRVEEIRAQLQEVRVKAREAAVGDGKDKEEDKKADQQQPAPEQGQAQGGEQKKWISPRLRQAQATGTAGSGGLSSSNPFGTGSSSSSRYSGGLGAGTRYGGVGGNAGGIRKVDTSDTMAFPTLGGGKVATAAKGAWGEGGGGKEVEEEEGVQGGESVFKFAGGGEGGEEVGGVEKEGEGEGEVKTEKKKKKKKKKDLADFEM
ncbi:hypothetical protein TrCOL_g13394 [Triparma columacea]|uniref:Uncharacterized protein n=1 Tax=Triparma columacea TaxID=722753 RepID=A0A9W7GMA7_9STRA|nr:hypothetical protein TrCOL_g13394 [Triparma columacea]